MFSFFCQLSSVAQLCPTLCNPMDCSTPGFPVHHQLLKLTQTHDHQIGDAIFLWLSLCPQKHRFFSNHDESLSVIPAIQLLKFPIRVSSDQLRSPWIISSTTIFMTCSTICLETQFFLPLFLLNYF